MSAVMTGPRGPEAPVDPVVDVPDTEELDLAALLVAASRPAPNLPPATPPGGPLRPPSSLASRPRRTTSVALEPGGETAVLPGRGVRALPGGRPPTGRATPGRDLPAGVIGGGPGVGAELGRLGLHLLLAALPLLAISAQVFGIVDMNISAGLLVLPLTAVMVAASVLRPLSSDRIVVAGMAWGLLATVVYDGFRLDTVYLLGWWGDFIPKMGTWLINTDPSNLGRGAIAGYVWRYLGDGCGIGVVFFVLAAATGLRRLGPRVTAAAAVGFAVFPVWAGLIATVALSPRGQTMMFPLTPTTIGLSLVGHLIFGLVLGLGAVRCPAIDAAWPWPPLLERLARRPGLGAQVAWAPISPARPAPVSSSAPCTAGARRAGLGGRPSASGRLPVPSVRLPATSSRLVASGPPDATSRVGALDAPSWPGSSARVVRGWPSSPRPVAADVR